MKVVRHNGVNRKVVQVPLFTQKRKDKTGYCTCTSALRVSFAFGLDDTVAHNHANFRAAIYARKL